MTYKKLRFVSFSLATVAFLSLAVSETAAAMPPSDEQPRSLIGSFTISSNVEDCAIPEKRLFSRQNTEKARVNVDQLIGDESVGTDIADQTPKEAWRDNDPLTHDRKVVMGASSTFWRDGQGNHQIRTVLKTNDIRRTVKERTALPDETVPLKMSVRMVAGRTIADGVTAYDPAQSGVSDVVELSLDGKAYCLAATITPAEAKLLEESTEASVDKTSSLSPCATWQGLEQPASTCAGLPDRSAKFTTESFSQYGPIKPIVISAKKFDKRYLKGEEGGLSPLVQRYAHDEDDLAKCANAAAKELF